VDSPRRASNQRIACTLKDNNYYNNNNNNNNNNSSNPIILAKLLIYTINVVKWICSNSKNPRRRLLQTNLSDTFDLPIWVCFDSLMLAARSNTWIKQLITVISLTTQVFFLLVQRRMSTCISCNSKSSS